jgi:hypothetical protein
MLAGIIISAVSINQLNAQTTKEMKRTGSSQPKKVLIISSSPSKGGNSDLLCDEFLRGAKEAGKFCPQFSRCGQLPRLHCTRAIDCHWLSQNLLLQNLS